MNILLSGGTGYIGLRLLPQLLEAGHTVHVLVRDRARFPEKDFADFIDRLHFIEEDLLEPPEGFQFPHEIQAAYFLVHAMGGGAGFREREAKCAKSFLEALDGTCCKQIVYLGGIVPSSGKLSEHLESRRAIEAILSSGAIPLTTLRASIIVGSGSASFEIIRDLTEKLPVMVAPRWVRNRCQPIAIRNVIFYLMNVLGREETLGRSFDIGGPEVLSYHHLLTQYAKQRGLHRYILPVPFLSLKFSSLWLYMMTSTSFFISRALVDSMAHETICENNDIRAIIPQELLTYDQAIDLALARIAQNRVPSSWYSSLASGRLAPSRLRTVHVPEHGVLQDKQVIDLTADRESVVQTVWSLGGSTGWPSMNWAWRLRGSLDRLIGGIGVRRGRRDPKMLRPGDALDFWRVLLADRENGRLILYAEMKLPGEAWLEFDIDDHQLKQTATFRPLGLWGRMYWILCLPFHHWLFPRMAHRLAAAGAR